jgi:hypothetical protein
LLESLENNFSDWWGAYLVHSLDVLSIFQEWGDNDRRLLAIALLRESLGDRTNGLSLSMISVATGMPMETARRQLAMMQRMGHCSRVRNLYRMNASDELVAKLKAQALAFCNALAACMAELGISVRGPSAFEFVSCFLPFFANVRRLFGKGDLVASNIGGILVMQNRVQLSFLKDGSRHVSRRSYNNKLQALAGSVFSVAEISQLSGEPLDRARRTLSHAEKIGAIVILGRDEWSYKASALRNLEGDQAYTRCVMDTLSHLLSRPESTAQIVRAWYLDGVVLRPPESAGEL